MSKKKKPHRHTTTPHKGSKKARAAVSAAYRSSLAGGNYGEAIARRTAAAAERALGAAFGAAMKAGLSAPKALTVAEKKAKASVEKALAQIGKAARLPSKGSASKASKPGKKASKKPPMVTADQVIAAAKTRWLCEGLKRSGCGGKAAVVSGKGSFNRLRPVRPSKAMTTG